MEDEITLDTVAGLGMAWSASVDDGPVGDPVTSVAGVHVSDGGSVYGFASDTGSRLWKHTPEPPGGISVTAVRDGRVLVGTEALTTQSLDPATGTSTGPLSTDHAFAAERDNLGAFWTLKTPQPGLGGAQVDVFDFDSSTWVCCDGLFWVSSSVLTPLTLGTETFFHGGQGLLSRTADDLGNGIRAYAIPATPCSWFPQAVCPTWARQLPGADTTAPVLNDDQSVVYAGTDAGTVHAVDAEDGDLLWSVSVDTPVTDAPALADGNLYVPTASGDLVVVDVASGTISWTAPTGSQITQQPAVAGGVVFTGSQDGAVHAFDATGCGQPTCDPVWSDVTESEITGAPAVSNGHVYVGTADGRLITYTP